MEASKEQRTVITTKEPHVVVLSAPASGKTFIIVERLKYLLDQGVEPSDIVCITFTNSAADNIKERLGARFSGGFVGTIHAYANFLLLSAGLDTSFCLKDDNFNQLFNMVYENPYVLRPVGHLLLDEAQDSTYQQFEFILDLVQPKNWMLVGDARQSIFQFAGAAPEELIDIAKRSDVVTYKLRENYRNGRAILDYAKGIIRRNGPEFVDDSIPMRDEEGQVYTMAYSTKGIIDVIRDDGCFKDWFVLTRTNSELNIIMSMMDKKGIPFVTFKKADVSNEQMREFMARDAVKVLTIHSAKGLEAPKVIVVGAKFYDPSEICTSYVAATRAKDLLIWTHTKPAPKRNKRIKTTDWEV